MASKNRILITMISLYGKQSQIKEKVIKTIIKSRIATLSTKVKKRSLKNKSQNIWLRHILQRSTNKTRILEFIFLIITKSFKNLFTYTVPTKLNLQST